ncbi:hypothetical protein NUW54_g13270 [Trametes sanguinea]|uniref:Uncharacterized protein n=1 Tax=Trametes sanguinea TaxID=158606 RepID=A0ACC1MPV4_9APHY|nr:hypothetical protein NUW54_g13270 [Trametes sanguinea]
MSTGRSVDGARDALDAERRESLVVNAERWVEVPSAAPERQEVLEESVATLGEDTLRVVLDRFKCVLAVADTHDHAAVLGNGGNGQVRRERVCAGELRDQTVRARLDQHRHAERHKLGIGTRSLRLHSEAFSIISNSPSSSSSWLLIALVLYTKPQKVLGQYSSRSERHTCLIICA